MMIVPQYRRIIMTNKTRKTITIDEGLEQPLENFSGSINDVLKTLCGSRVLVNFIKSKSVFNLSEIVRLGLEAKADKVKSEVIKQNSYNQLFGKVAQPEQPASRDIVVRDLLNSGEFVSWNELVDYAEFKHEHLRGKLSEDYLQGNQVAVVHPQYYTKQFIRRFGYDIRQNNLVRV